MFDGLQRVHGRWGESEMPIGVTLVPVGERQARIKDRYSSGVSSGSKGSNSYLLRPRGGCSMLDGLQLVVGKYWDSAVPIGVTLAPDGEWEVHIKDRPLQ